jgi:quinoprotein glucose dehydrogenase
MRSSRGASAVLSILAILALCAVAGYAWAAPLKGKAPQAAKDRMVPDPPGVSVSVWASGLNVPWSLVFLPDGRALVSERGGRIVLLDKDGTPRESSYALMQVSTGGEGGLMGLALDPRFPDAPFVYAMETRSKNGKDVNAVVRLKHIGDHAVLDKTVVDDIPSGTFHNGGRIGFGPDGLLYIGTGDSTHPELAADKNSLAGKILRVKPDGTIPSDNPIKDSPVYSYGHRNVQGLAWRPGTRDLYESEHGPTGEFGLHARDEINRIKAGGNYGWPAATCAAHKKPLIDPLACWTADAIAPGGIAFFDGDLMVATLRGEGLIRVKFGRGDRVTAVERWFASAPGKGRYGRLRDVVMGPDKALYVLTSNRDGRGTPQDGDDRILKLAPEGSNVSR